MGELSIRSANDIEGYTRTQLPVGSHYIPEPSIYPSLTTNTNSPINLSTSNQNAKKLSTKVNELLGVNYLSSRIIKTKKGHLFLEISRLASDEYNPAKRSKSCLFTIKKRLGIKDNVISKNNDSISATNRRTWSDSATIEPGSSIVIPLSELGKREGLDGFFNKKDYAELRKLSQAIK